MIWLMYPIKEDINLEYAEDTKFPRHRKTSNLIVGAVPSLFLGISENQTVEDDGLSGCSDYEQEMPHTSNPSIIDTNENVRRENIVEEEPDSDASIKKEPSEGKNRTEPNERPTNTCRLCLQKTVDTKNIFEDRLEDNVPIALAILACIYPIEISKNDPLPQNACMECLHKITSYFQFRSFVLRNDQSQRKKYGHYVTDDSAEEYPTYKRSLIREDNTSINKRRKRVLSENIPFDDDGSDISIGDFDGLKQNTGSPPPLVLMSSKKHNEKSEDMISVEQKLRKILRGKLTPELENAENIIIHIQNDQEFSDTDVVTTKVKVHTIPRKELTEKERKTVFPGMGRRLTKYKSSAVAARGKQSTSEADQDISSHSVIGTFPGTTVDYLFGSKFCIVDDYLFEFRLTKGNLRHLRCAVSTCNSVGNQMLITPGLFSNSVNIMKPHNHSKPSSVDRKVQMFHCVMRKRVQCDRGSSFRSIYEELCKLDPEIAKMVPMRKLINEICSKQLDYVNTDIKSFQQFYDQCEYEALQKIQYTVDGTQFYQEKFTTEDNAQAIIFANVDTMQIVSTSMMYVDASFKIDTNDRFTYQLVTVLVWIQDSYYPILFALVSQKSQLIYKKIFTFLREVLMPSLKPDEIITDYEANLYYALGETFPESNISGSVFYYTQNLYKQICTLNLCRDLETNSYFRNIYHMLLMLPLLPVNTILDGLNNIEIQAKDLGLQELAKPLFEHIHNEWIMKVTPELFCVHRMETRINENVVAPFKKLRDYLMLCKSKTTRQSLSIINVVERIVVVENFLRTVYFSNEKKSFSKDLNSAQKRNVIKAWQYIENYPKININHFFLKVLGYIKCMENQLWIWGFYRYSGGITDELIDAKNFSIISSTDYDEIIAHKSEEESINSNDCELVKNVYTDDNDDNVKHETDEEDNSEIIDGNVVMEGVIDENGTFILPESDGHSEANRIDTNNILKFIQNDINE